MPALSVIDLAMFLLETPERPFNVGPLIVLDPPARGRSTFADRLAARMLKRPLGTPFNYRLRTPLLGLDALWDGQLTGACRPGRSFTGGTGTGRPCESRRVWTGRGCCGICT